MRMVWKEPALMVLSCSLSRVVTVVFLSSNFFFGLFLVFMVYFSFFPGTIILFFVECRKNRV